MGGHWVLYVSDESLKSAPEIKNKEKKKRGKKKNGLLARDREVWGLIWKLLLHTKHTILI